MQLGLNAPTDIIQPPLTTPRTPQNLPSPTSTRLPAPKTPLFRFPALCWLCGESMEEEGLVCGAERVEKRVATQVHTSPQALTTTAFTSGTSSTHLEKLRPRKIAKFNPEAPGKSQKRPRSEGLLVEETTKGELLVLIQEAVKLALKDTTEELEKLRKESKEEITNLRTMVQKLRVALERPQSDRDQPRGRDSSGRPTGTAQQTARPNTGPNKPPTSGALNYAQILESGLALASPNGWKEV
ncbi:hypothetical protein EX30DRAFT_380004 [Ascodesmis nigricans]|uniref:Uncharacterized protein n=1 Tax=Ascodesmis nigricans TaxID=341454 RepID=A0A4S2MTT5_9PEZI|nr:hypothetical protein EX30DRAFT_380004 [Ascodesmis nigricans]